ncbi:MAG: T9SS type A sorting domain-containing protein [Bacteroidetes bacterium]|nr:T9SS type A sorting domain-containing protein [Bacteroidota bacterium]
MAWTQDDGGDMNTYFVHSTAPDEITSWTTPQIATQTTTGNQFFPWLTINSTGHISLVYYQENSNGDVDVYSAQSFDGQSFTGEDGTGEDVKLTSVSSDPNVGATNFASDYIGVASDNSGEVHALWTDFRSGTNEDIYCANYNQQPTVTLTGPTYIDAGGSGAYYLINGSQSSSIQVDLGTSIALQAVPQNSNWAFAGWSDVTDVANPRTEEPGSNFTTTANFKDLQHSLDSTAYSRSGQTRFIRVGDGMLVQTYTDGGHVWVEYNNGSGWQLANNGSPLDGTAGGKSPSLAWNEVQGNYYIAVVWEQQNGTGYTLQGTVINDPGGGKTAYIDPVAGTRTIFTEPSDAYTDDADPNIVLNSGLQYLVTFDRFSTSGSLQPGINWLAGSLQDNNGTTNDFCMSAATGGPWLIPGTNANCTAAAIANDPYGPEAINAQLLFVENYRIYEQYLNAIYVNGGWYYSANNSATWLDDFQPYDYDPSVVALPYQQFAACWVDNISSTNVDGSWPQVDQMTYFTSNSPSTFDYYGDGVQSCAINLGYLDPNNGDAYGYCTWSQIYSGTWSDEAFRYNAGVPYSQEIVSTGTTGKFIQLGNGDGSDQSNAFVSSFSPFTEPYSFSMSQDLGNLIVKSKRAKSPGDGVLTNPADVVVGRGCIINKGRAAFIYRFGDLNVDGQNVGFVNAPGSNDYHKISNVDSVLETQPFELQPGSKVVFSQRSGFVDSAAAVEALGDNGYIGYSVEVVDAATNKVIGTIRNVDMKASNLHGFRSTSYQLSPDGISGQNVRIRIAVSTNLDSAAIALTKSYTLENTALQSGTQSISLQSLTVIKDFTLNQNYPNPFNPTTVISYSIPKAVHVSLKIYDVLGREVETLVNDNQNVGRYEVQFDGRRFASGVYFYRLVAGSHVITKKMLMLK